jgi:hypothetical protein
MPAYFDKLKKNLSNSSEKKIIICWQHKVHLLES